MLFLKVHTKNAKRIELGKQAWERRRPGGMFWK
jgi:hypothetical protein